MVIHECHILELRIEMKVNGHRILLALLKQKRERLENFRPERGFEPSNLCSALPVELSGKLGAGRYIGLLTHPHWPDNSTDRALHRHRGNALITNGQVFIGINNNHHR